MKPHESGPEQGSRSVLVGRRFLACRECGWVHYVMTAEEKAASDRLLERYQLSEAERLIYESAFRQCLRCESPASEFAAAAEEDLARAAGHLVTPVCVDAEVGTN
ncbi:MAG: hypothetical protein HYZ72_01525 [Deltaproteobacteria bacterium]|nr:hypothetical protein [Deltaproteobacteria bacterium]